MVGVVVRRDGDELRDWLRAQRPHAAALLEKLGLEPSDFLSSEIGLILSLCTFRGAPVELDLFQMKFLASKAPFRSMLKSRQVGYSFIMAAEQLARCILFDNHVGVFVSYNLDDAKEKISLVKELHDELPLEWQKSMVIDSKTEVGFASVGGRHRGRARLKSFPSKAPRGLSGDVYLDEFAHVLNDRTIYTGATSVTVRQKGAQFSIGSTPLGKRGMFYEIHSGAGGTEYQDYWRQEVPWWLCRQFSRDVLAAQHEAPLLPTEERVQRFGTSNLLKQFAALPLDSFRQEYELDWQDERVAFFPIDLVLGCCRFEREEIPIFDSIERLATEASALGPLFAGFDVGRTKHPSELMVLEQRGEELVLRYQESMREAEFDFQKARLGLLIDALGPHLRALRVDTGGLGMNLGEDLRKQHGSKVEEWTFTAPVKVELANGLKILLERRALVLPRDRDLVTQLGSIRQKITTSGNAVFDVDQNARFHHGDKVWSLALAAYKKGRAVRTPASVSVREIGGGPPVPPRSRPSAPPPGRAFASSSVPASENPFIVRDEDFIPRRPEFAREAETPEERALDESTPEALRTFSDEVLRRRAHVLLTAAGALRDNGDSEGATKVRADYYRVWRELDRRRRTERAGGAGRPEGVRALGRLSHGFILVEKTDREALKRTLVALPQVRGVEVFPCNEDGTVVDERGPRLLVRLDEGASFARFAMEHQGYARVVRAWVDSTPVAPSV